MTTRAPIPAGSGFKLTKTWLGQLCPKSPNGPLLCGTSVFSVSLWLMNSEQNTPQRHREHRGSTEKTQELGLLRQSRLGHSQNQHEASAASGLATHATPVAIFFTKM